MFQPKYWNVMQEQTKLKDLWKIASQRKMNVRKQQLKNFEISAEEISFQIMSFLLSIMNTFTVGTEKYCPKCKNLNMQKTFRCYIMIKVSIFCLEVANHKYWLI